MAEIPHLKITISGSDGVKPLADLATITVGIPRELSLRVASMHVLEFVMREIKKKLKDALKGIGCK